RRDARSADHDRGSRPASADRAPRARHPRLDRRGGGRAERSMKPAADGRDTVALLHWGFVVAGMATTLLGPLLPALAARWAMSDAAAGALFTAQFLSSTTLTIASGAVTARLGSGRTLGAGFLLIAIGVGVLGVAPQPLG